jgi:DNA-binding LacI/PurR family transcriptional regulator
MLIKQGARKIVLVNGPSRQIFSDCTQGYMKALNEAGINFDEQNVISCQEDTALCAAEKFGDWLKNNPDIDSIYAAGERLQTGVRQALWNSERRDIMLASVSYGVSPSANVGFQLKISASEIASEAVALMGRKLANPKKAPECINISAR